MALNPAPMFRGLITITTGINDTIHWWESDGTPFNLSIVLGAGSSYPEDLAADIASAMTSESIGSGMGTEYQVTIDSETGVVTITASFGTFYPKLTTTETQKFLTGGDQIAGDQGDNHYGWIVDSSYRAGAISHASDTQHDHAWYPDQSPANDDRGRYSFPSIEGKSMGGKTNTYTFAPTDLNYSHIRTQSYRLLSDVSKGGWLDYFISYALQGSPDGRFRYYNDRTLGSYDEMHLTADSIKEWGPERSTRLATWDWIVQMRRYKA